jgi:hypothetical protein
MEEQFEDTEVGNRKTDITIVKRKGTKDKTLHRKLQIEQHEPH